MRRLVLPESRFFFLEAFRPTRLVLFIPPIRAAFRPTAVEAFFAAGLVPTDLFAFETADFSAAVLGPAGDFRGLSWSPAFPAPGCGLPSGLVPPCSIFKSSKEG